MDKIPNTLLYYNRLSLEHDTGEHPENSGRIYSLKKHLEHCTIAKTFDWRIPQNCDEKIIEKVHHINYIQKFNSAVKTGEHIFGTPDCLLSSGTYQAALSGVSAGVTAAEDLKSRKNQHAFCIVRPPGHHAEKNQSMGFCFFNNIAICAEYLIANNYAEKVAIIDFDVHHGNGTQHHFENRADVFFASIHQSPLSCYPGTGFSHEIGKGKGTGATLNIPLDPYANHAKLQQVFLEQLTDKLLAFKADFLLVSAGFDAHKDDPLAQLNYEDETYHFLGEQIKTLSKETTTQNIISFLEGGYNYQSLASSAENYLKGIHFKK